jgi:RimJ/RimL family protein N-acetyltransferase
MMAFWPRFEPSPGLVADWHRRLPDLVCPGFRLREPRLGDAERLSAAFGPEAASTLGIAAPGTSDEWMHFVARVRTGRAARHTVCYAVVPDASADIGGLVLLQRLAPRSRAATVSFVFSEAHWETDLPAVSAACMLTFAFQAVGVGRVEGRAGASREAEVVRRLGAVTEGLLRQSQPVGDGFADQILWSVLATEWVQSDHSVPSVSVRVEQEPPLPADPTSGGEVDRPAWTVRLPTLEGSVVTLREVDLLDVPALLDALEPADLEVAFEPAPNTPDEFRRYVSWVRLQRAEGRAAGFAIVPRGARRAAGLLQVRLADLPGAVAEWGIVLASSHRGTGAASEAARLMAGFAFETLGVHRLETRASGISTGSISLLRKLGAVREAHMRQSFAHGSEVVDDDLWAIVKSDWHDPHAVPGGRKNRVPRAPAR